MDTPQWLPRTVDELRGAAESGAFTERHYCDIKRVLDKGEKGNRSLAIDLAAFAIDGGVVVVGLDEGQSPPALSPNLIRGAKERIDQVARSRIDPPLAVTVHEIAADDAGQGFLVIVVPASPAAPHMVEGRYRGRSDTTNTILSDPEVRRVRALRAEALRSIHQVLKGEIDRDPVPQEAREQAHLFVVAQPAYADPEMLQRALGSTWREWIAQEVLNVPRLDQEWSPDFREVQHRVHRSPDGWTATSLQPGRVTGDAVRENHLLDLEIREDGGVRLFCGRASDTFARSHGSEGRKVILEVIVAGLAIRVVRAARLVSEKGGYVGNWDLGLAITGIRHTYSYAVASTILADPLPYAADSYVQTTSATFAELMADPDAIVERLFGRLNRGLADGRYAAPRYR